MPSTLDGVAVPMWQTVNVRKGQILKCGKILKENTTNGKEVSWKVFWIRVDAHKRRLSAMRELDKIKEEKYKK